MLVSRILFIIQALDKGRTLEVHHLPYRRPTGSDLKDNLITLTAAVEARTMAIAGQAQAETGRSQVWFTSTESFAKVLSNKNRALLATIAATHPVSLQELAGRTGRKASNLSRTLKTMEHYGFVRLHRGERGRVRPEVPYQAISLELAFSA